MKRKATSEVARPDKRERPDHESPTSMTKERRDECLTRYSTYIPEKLTDLDTLRFGTIPKSISSRAEPHLTKDELVKLVEWKLKHGTFRPALLGMAKKHDPELIISTTTSAFSEADPIAALRTLIALKGIGPATASLLLSCRDDHTPFFSDELFRWVMWDEPGGGGWDRTIKYTEKEYRVFVIKVKEILNGMKGVTAWDLEKVAYVLAREEGKS